MATPPFNPLDKSNLGHSVATALLLRPPFALPPSQGFDGAGVYAIYYHGDLAVYSGYLRSSGEKERPIYVGKAVPPGARKGGFGLNLSAENALFKRLKDHASSIAAAVDLRTEDFSCQYLVTDDIWIPLAEAVLIERFKPIWNVMIDGFGNHDPGSGRYEQQGSAWDVLHPGRQWATKLKGGSRSKRDIEAQARDYIEQNAAPKRSAEDAVLSDD